jgi:hypothetical protein
MNQVTLGKRMLDPLQNGNYPLSYGKKQEWNP